MPQLDITAYFSEYLWTVISFFTFYYFLSKFFLPAFARALLFEQKKYSENFHGTIGELVHSQEDPFLETLWTKGKKLLQSWVFFYEKNKNIKSSKLSQKKTELCTTLSQALESYPAFLSKTKKNSESLHLSFLEYSSNSY